MHFQNILTSHMRWAHKTSIWASNSLRETADRLDNSLQNNAATIMNPITIMEDEENLVASFEGGPVLVPGLTEEAPNVDENVPETMNEIMEVEEPLPREVVAAATPERLEDQMKTPRLAFRHILHYMVALLIPVLNAGNTIITKKALDAGMRFYVFSFYRNLIATSFLLPFVLLNRNSIPRMTLRVFLQILILTVLEPVLDQNFSYAGSRKVPATFLSCMAGISPALTFLAAWLFRLETVKTRERRSQGKLLGTTVVVVGAITVGLYRGKTISLSSTSGSGALSKDLRENWVSGPIFVMIALLSAVSYNILLGKTVEKYPAPLALTAFTCTAGAIMNCGVAVALEGRRGVSWMLGWNIKLLSYFYAGLIISGLAMYIQNTLTRMRGPVFVTAFSPLSMVFVMTVGSLALGESLHLGSVIGATVIIVGLLVLLWGKSGRASPTISKDVARESGDGVAS